MELNRLKLVLVVCMVLFFCGATSYAQTFGEFFNQKKTQKRYLLEQIAALEVYTSYLKKGYEIASSGLETIRDFSNGEFGLHEAFISGLKKVSPAVKNNVKVAQIIEMQIRIGKGFWALKSNPNLSLSNQMYVQEVRDNLWEECMKDLEELLLVITSGKVEMPDDERLERLDKIYVSMSSKSAFVQHFASEVTTLIRQRELEKQTIEKLRRSDGIQD
ncbi:hypothetical protein [Pedobacter helvus]|uniref:TerB family tellurite resistance protein n=1 Tax=Pedobacter helvus TaxID=2563444 RepID=A0ABW9JM72_9SPHI|nr:hypothetical protein [Pedobacter ureilyticus]